MTQEHEEDAAAALRAVELVENDQVLGLGTGRAAASFVRALGRRVGQGLRVRGVATSDATAELASTLGIPLVSLEQAGQIDITFDGADEVDPQLDLIKGYGGALVREKIVASLSERLVILVGPEKLVPKLGARGKLPVEVVPFGSGLCRRRLQELGCDPHLRTGPEGDPFLTDNGNQILDCKIALIDRPGELDTEIQAIPGVVGTGLFVGMADLVIVQDGDRAELKRRPES